MCLFVPACLTALLLPQVQALNVPGSAFDISGQGNWLAAGDSDGTVRVSGRKLGQGKA